jgi:hypothetical protein
MSYILCFTQNLKTKILKQVEQQSFAGTTASSHIPSPYETAVTPAATTPATVFLVTEPPFQQLQQQQEPKQVENIALGQLYNGVYVSPAAAPTPRPFEPLYEPEVPAAAPTLRPFEQAANNYQLPASSATAAVQTNYNVQVSIFSANLQNW